MLSLRSLVVCNYYQHWGGLRVQQGYQVSGEGERFSQYFLINDLGRDCMGWNHSIKRSEKIKQILIGFQWEARDYDLCLLLYLSSLISHLSCLVLANNLLANCPDFNREIKDIKILRAELRIKQSLHLNYVELTWLAQLLVRISILANIYCISLAWTAWTYLLTTVHSYQQLPGFVGRQFWRGKCLADRVISIFIWWVSNCPHSSVSPHVDTAPPQTR